MFDDVEITRRFWSKVKKTNVCWIWTDTPYGTLPNGGYGRLNIGNNVVKLAHRVAWFVFYGEWPDKLVLHTCDNRICVRKSHLYLGTDADNSKDCSNRRRRWIDRQPEKCSKHLTSVRFLANDAIWITNGRKSKRLLPGLPIPIGWWHGRSKMKPYKKRVRSGYRSGISADDVRYIRESKKACKLLAEEFSVSSSLISFIRNRKVWKNVD